MVRPTQEFWDRLHEARRMYAKFKELQTLMKDKVIALRQNWKSVEGTPSLDELIELAKLSPPPPEYFEGEVENPFIDGPI